MHTHTHIRLRLLKSSELGSARSSYYTLERIFTCCSLVVCDFWAVSFGSRIECVALAAIRWRARARARASCWIYCGSFGCYFFFYAQLNEYIESISRLVAADGRGCEDWILFLFLFFVVFQIFHFDFVVCVVSFPSHRSHSAHVRCTW